MLAAARTAIDALGSRAVAAREAEGGMDLGLTAPNKSYAGYFSAAAWGCWVGE